MLNQERREAVRQFINRWKGGGDEKQDCHPFWIELLHDVLGVENPTSYIRFEKKVKLSEGDGKIHTRYIDGYIADVHVLIEQKGSKHPLDEKEPQSGGEFLTPYEQAKRYDNNLPKSEKADWIVTCNFREIWIYNMNTSVPEPEKLNILELQDKYKQLDFLVKKDVKEISHEMQVSIQAGDIVGQIYDAFMKQYGIPEKAPKGETPEEKSKREHKLRSLNALCVRLVFLLYAEDADIFQRDQFLDYMRQFSVKDSRRALIDLFKVLDTPVPERDEYLEEDLAAFPYVNGGLFADENIEIPPFNEELRRLLLEEASEGFDWKDISPTIFGAVFESTLNPETRRAGGMHYTSVENIHKVIDPLFLDGLKAEFQEIRQISVPKTRKQKLEAFQDKLASLTFLDPAAGSGNFLTESYLSLRRLENEVIRDLVGNQIALDVEQVNPIKVSIQQFYGIEINDFAVTVAKTALWIAESQMLDETKSILYNFAGDFLPLKTYVNITEGNALRIDWNDVIPAEKLNYIMGNPPFVGYAMQSNSQKADLNDLLPGIGKNIDYVLAWYYKAAEMMLEAPIQAAFVSTNSISQGEQVDSGMRPLFEKYDIGINFAYRTFCWDSEASIQAHVHCVIIGFSNVANLQYEKKLFDSTGECNKVENINAYLLAAPNIFIHSRKKNLMDVPEIVKGSSPVDGGNLLLNDIDKIEIEKSDKIATKYIRKFYGAKEYLHNVNRWCFWLENVSPTDIAKSAVLKKHIDGVRQFRLNSKKAATRRFAEYPTKFMETRQPREHYILVPRHSSQNRRYIPFGFVSPDIICGDANNMIPDASLFLFGVLISNVHMSWVRAICGRIKSDYRYSNDIVYNNFPWPTPSPEQKATIEKTAQGILDARDLYPESSLADLYDPLTMPPELRKAHVANDRAVMAAYGFSTKMSESDCVAKLMEMYQQLTAEENSKKK